MAYSTFDWVITSQYEFDGVVYKHYWVFPINEKIIPIMPDLLIERDSCRVRTTNCDMLL